MINLKFSVEELLAACAVLRSRGRFSPGFDKMTPDAAYTWIKINGEKLCRELNSAAYDVMPASGFNTAKYDGSYRRHARLTAIDTVIQSVIIDKLSGFMQDVFSANSYAYIRGRGTGSALAKYCEYAGVYPFAVKIDPESCFDNIDYDILNAALEKMNFTAPARKLLMDFAKMPAVVEGQLLARSKGILQGAPLSGLLCNIYFHALDTELENRGIPFVRYADDIAAFAGDENTAAEIRGFISSFVKNNLALKVNKTKTFTGASEKAVFLGARFSRDKYGHVSVRPGERGERVQSEWYEFRPVSSGKSVDILSDGILRQKDFSVLFDSVSEKNVIPVDNIGRINIFSSVVFDSKFLNAMSGAGIYVNVFGSDYSFKGRFVPAGPLKDQRLIFEQLQVYNTPEERLSIAKEFVLASVHNLRLVIRYYNKHYPDKTFNSAIAGINVLCTGMKKAETIESLMLLEAKARAAYYRCYDRFIRVDGFAFEKRSKRPPLNELNSMISFGNTVLYNYIATEIYKSSLDIRVGFLHGTNRREESLNLDIAEIFRPLVVDRVVFTLINRGEIGLDCFEHREDGGVYLNNQGKRLFLRGFYEKLSSTQMVKDKSCSYAMIIDGEIRKLTRRFRSGEKYKAFRQVR